VELAALGGFCPDFKRIGSVRLGIWLLEISEQAEIHVKYDGYLEKENVT
jgi:hypothetical protein